MNEGFYHPLERVSQSSLLVSTASDKIIRLYCPIQAVCILSIHSFYNGDRVTITAIEEDEQARLLYQIDGLPFPYNHFEILNQT